MHDFSILPFYSSEQCPPHSQRTVQLRPDLLHLHWPLHAFLHWFYDTYPEPDLSKNIFHIESLFFPQPILCRTWELWVPLCCLPLYVSSLIGSTWNVLHKGSLWWENALQTTRLPGEKVLCCRIDLTKFICSGIYQHHKRLNHYQFNDSVIS